MASTVIIKSSITITLRRGITVVDQLQSFCNKHEIATEREFLSEASAWKGIWVFFVHICLQFRVRIVVVIEEADHKITPCAGWTAPTSLHLKRTARAFAVLSADACRDCSINTFLTCNEFRSGRIFEREGKSLAPRADSMNY